MISRALAAAALLAASLPLAIAACTSNVRIGDTRPAPDPQCAGATCNTTCAISGCPEGTTVCGAPSIVGYCDLDGYCVTTPPPCPPPGPCAGMPCGAMCNPCPPSDPTTTGCAVPDPGTGPYQCDGNGSCVPGTLVCACTGPNCPPPWDPCAGMPCGAMCDPCNPADPTCPPPPETMGCDHTGACVPLMGLMCPPPYVPCLQKVCGEPCTLCPPMDPTCMEPPGPKACNDVGMCVMAGTVGCAADAGAADGGMPGP